LSHEFSSLGDIEHKGEHSLNPTHFAHFEEEPNATNTNEAVPGHENLQQPHNIEEPTPTNNSVGEILDGVCPDVAQIGPDIGETSTNHLEEPTVPMANELGQPQ